MQDAHGLGQQFVDLAGLRWADTGMAPTSGRSFTDVFRATKSGRVDPARDHVIVGRERNDIGRPRDEGYPIRGLVTDTHLYLHNFEPTRWPAGNPETGYLDTDASPTKTWLIAHRDDPKWKSYYDHAFGRRPGEELYDLKKDPDQMKNVAGDPAYAAAAVELGVAPERLVMVAEPAQRFDDAQWADVLAAMIDGFDVVVLGGGPGGYAAALYGGSAGLKVAVVEGDDVLNRVPALRERAVRVDRALRVVAHVRRPGLRHRPRVLRRLRLQRRLPRRRVL